MLFSTILTWTTPTSVKKLKIDGGFDTQVTQVENFNPVVNIISH